MNVGTDEDLLAQIGYGGIHFNGIVGRLIEMHRKEIATAPPDISDVLREISPTPARSSRNDSGILVEGESGYVVRLAKCCNPIPGDEICGYVTRGRGVSVHRVDCPNILSGTEINRMIEVSWAAASDQTYVVNLEIICKDQSGVLTEILAVPSTLKLNIHSIRANPNKSNKTSTIRIGIDVMNAEQAANVVAQIRKVRGVYSVARPVTPVGD